MVKTRYRSLPRDAVSVQDGDEYLFSKGLTNQSIFAGKYGEEAEGGAYRPQYSFNSGDVSVTTAAQQVLAASRVRVSVLFQNKGTVDIFLGFNVIPGPAGENGTKLVPDAVYSFADNGIVPSLCTVYVVGAGASVLHINEGIQVE